ncbi:MAG: type I-C CRISPR-associated protein Cas8c/Csd1 [Gammaproteobacteria bacterium]|nr:type I-C CRISPR-associated protein Cas8c/Csd1 [Gammaproteobacteria bacterium]
MILQALAEYYERKAEAGDELAPAGFEFKEIPFILEIDAEGRLIQIEDTRESEGKKKRARAMLVPQAVKKTSGVAANLLWDTAEYLLGIDTRGKPERVTEQHSAFKARIGALSGAEQDAGIQAIEKFYDSLELSSLEGKPVWQEIIETNPNLTFRLQGDQEPICQRPIVIESIRSAASQSDGPQRRCLISGEADEIERLHTAIKGVWGAQSSGANIVSFNLDAFNSYGKSQGENAPVGKRAAFAYTTSLNHLLAKDSAQRMQVGDASTVFWSEKATDLESGVVNIFGEPPKDDPDRNVRAVEQLFKSVQNGRYIADDNRTHFYVLGLAPNAARIAVRFWHVGTVGEMAERIVQHFGDLKIVHGSKEPEFLSLFRLLISTASLGKSENIPSNLAGDVMRAIIEGLPYPKTLLGAAIRRIKAEQHVSYPRAALIKACINRATRYSNPVIKEELKVSLDIHNNNIGYRLGRLFAVLEKAQEEANPGINATIRDRYYGSASSSPVTVFSTLMKLNKHHIGKLGKGRAVNIERLIGEIVSEVQDFPAHLPIGDQGRFAIGYYHQRQDFFTKKTEEREMIHE